MNNLIANVGTANGNKDSNFTGAWQLIHTGSALAPWIHSDQYTALPKRLQYGPVRLLHDALENADSPHISTRLLNDTLVLLTFGTKYLKDSGCQEDLFNRLCDLQKQREMDRTDLQTQALRIQLNWRCQRFPTHRLPPIDFKPCESLIPEAQHLMSVTANPLSVMKMAPVSVNEEELQTQLLKYSKELMRRMETRKRENEALRLRIQREHHQREENKKKMFYQKKRRHENAIRRWNYFAVRILRAHRDEIKLDVRSRIDSKQKLGAFTKQSSLYIRQSNKSISQVHQQANWQPNQRHYHPIRLKHVVYRDFIQNFVAQTITHGLNRVLCALNMEFQVEQAALCTPNLPNAPVPNGQEAFSRRLRIGILLCDALFGEKYIGFYQRFFERAASAAGVAISWELFNCIKSQLPSKAWQRALDGFLVAGGPNPGWMRNYSTDGMRSSNNASTQQDGDTSRRSNVSSVWRHKLVKLLQYLHGRTLLCGLGFGHVLLAESLGGKIAVRDWVDGWTILEPSIVERESIHASLLSDNNMGIKYLHGEFVESMDQAKGGRAWLNADQNFVSCYRDKCTLSFDGFPECGSIVFDTMSELYDCDKGQHSRETATQCGSLNATTIRNLIDGRNRGIATPKIVQPLEYNAEISLEKKKKLADVTDASQLVAQLLLEHFLSNISEEPFGTSVQRLSLQTTSQPMSGRLITEVIAMINGYSDDDDLEKNIGAVASSGNISAVYMSVRTTVDGHLAVLGRSLRTLWAECEKDQQASRAAKLIRRHSGNSQQPHSPMTLRVLRDPNLLEKEHQQVSGSMVNLPAIRTAIGTVEDMAFVGNPCDILKKQSFIAHQRAKSAGLGVLTLSEVLVQLRSRHIASREESNNTDVNRQSSLPIVMLQFADEECSHPCKLQRQSPHELRVLWLRLVAALRLGEIPDERTAIVARQTRLLDYFRRRQPLWTFIKDCRRSTTSLTYVIQKMRWHARYAGVLLFDHHVLLAHSAKDVEALFHNAQYYGLKVYVTHQERAKQFEDSNIDNVVVYTSPTHRSSLIIGTEDRRYSSNSSLIRSNSLYRKMSNIGGDMMPLIEKGNQSAFTKEKDIAELMILQFAGVHGIITSAPEIVIDAKQKQYNEDSMIRKAEKFFRIWQSKQSDKKNLDKRFLLRSDNDEPLDETHEDYIDEDVLSDLDDVLNSAEIVAEMTQQYSEHCVQQPPSCSSSYVQLRPLQPKCGNQVLSGRRPSKVNKNAESIVEGTSPLHLIGSWKKPLKRSMTVQDHTTILLKGASKDNHQASIRPAESAIRGVQIGSALLANPPPMGMMHRKAPRLRRYGQSFVVQR